MLVNPAKFHKKPGIMGLVCITDTPWNSLNVIKKELASYRNMQKFEAVSTKEMRFTSEIINN